MKNWRKNKTMIRIVFFGTPQIAVKSLEYLNSLNDMEVLAVVTQPDKPAGRGNKLTMSPVKQFALANSIPVFQPKSIRKEPDVQEELKKLNPDFFVTFAFGQILSQEVLDIPRFYTINLHASLLPRYRGANPIQRAIINGDKETGICTMVTELGLDCGDVCMKKTIEIPDDMTCEQLSNEISELSPKLLEETLRGLYLKTLTPVPQSAEGVCMANKVAKEETLIDWAKTPLEIHNLVRGIYKSPGAYFIFNDKIIKVMETACGNSLSEENYGEIIGATKEGVEFACKGGSVIVKKVKPEGKGEMPARDWYNGIKNRVNKK